MSCWCAIYGSVVWCPAVPWRSRQTACMLLMVVLFCLPCSLVGCLLVAWLVAVLMGGIFNLNLRIMRKDTFGSRFESTAS
jgi:hypothetical protein